MISKQEKLKYGEILRQQMKEKEDQKKAQKRETVINQEQTMSPPPPPQQPVFRQPPAINLDAFKSDRQLKKQQLAKKMQEGNYNPYGKVGGGAPNKQQYAPQTKNQQPPQQMRENTYEQRRVQQHQQYQPQYNDQFRNNPQMRVQEQRYQRIPTPQFLQGAYNNAQFISPQYAPSAPYGYININDKSYDYLGKIQVINKNIPQVQSPYEAMKNIQPQAMMRRKPDPLQPPRPMKMPQQQIPQQVTNMRELQQDIFRKGGRNLLKFQNEVPEQMISKQNQKLRLQQELKKQIDDAARRKVEEEKKLREEDQKLQRRNQQFLANLKKNQQEEKRKGDNKIHQQPKIQPKQTNQKAIHVQPSKANNGIQSRKQKFERIKQQVARREEEERRQAQTKQKQNKVQRQVIPSAKPNKMAAQNLNEMDEVNSAISNDTQMSKGFNTAISKQYFKKEREKSGIDRNKMDKFTEQLHKMRKQIMNQGHQFQRQIQKVQNQAVTAKRQKQMADLEIAKLKHQLKEKMDYNNKKYLGEIYQGKVQVKDPYYADEVRLEQREVHSLRPRKNQNLVLQEYKPERHGHYEQAEQVETMRNDSEMMSLIGDSKKIPIDITTNEPLTISNLDGFAKDTDFFRKNKVQQQPTMQKRYNPNQSIQEEDQERIEDSRQSRRAQKEKPKEELEIMMESRKKSRGGWGDMSSVNSDMVNQIQNMLQDKQRPKSHLSSMGEKTLLSYQNQQLMNPKTKTKQQDTNNRNRKSSSVSSSVGGKNKLDNLDQLLNKYI